MSQPPPYYQQPPPGYGYPSESYPPGPQQAVIINNPQQQIYVPPKHKSVSQSIAGSLGGALGSAIRSGGQLARGGGKVATSTARSVGASVAGIAKGGASMANESAAGFKDSLDRTATSPLLSCFLTGSGIQLVSKTGKGCLRSLQDGTLDGRGQLGNDYSCHWLVVNRWENKVILRNGAFPQFHLAIGMGNTSATGSGDRACVFKLHETLNHYITLQAEVEGHYVAVDAQQNIVPPAQASGNNAQFEVYLVYSPVGHVYKPVH